MAFFNTKERRYIPQPIPPEPPYDPPVPPTPPEPEEGSEPNIPRPSYTHESTLYLYRVYDDAATLHKTLHDQKGYNISFKDDVNLQNPVFVIQDSDDLTNYNYAYLQLNDTYYFCTIECMTGNLYRIICNKDVLTTNAESLEGLEVIIDKYENAVDNFLNDGSYIMQSKDTTQAYNFATGFNNEAEYILICAGG